MQLRAREEAAESAETDSRDRSILLGGIVGDGGEGEFGRGILGEVGGEEVAPGSFWCWGKR